MSAKTTENKSDNYIVIASYSKKPKEQLKLLGEMLSKRYGVEGCKIIVDDKSERGVVTADDVRGKIVIGNMIPSYLAIPAKEVIEVNTQGFFNVPARLAAQMTEDEMSELFNYDRSYRVVSTKVESHLPQKPEQTM